MDFVISNVTTVQEDDEPLLEISKVTVLNEKRPYFDTKEVRNHSPKYTKLCFVPLCPNTSRSTPEKMFITVPVNPARRKQWFDAVGKSTLGKNPKSPFFCCEDHFNLKYDMKNYQEHLKRGRVQMLLYQTAVPHIFACNRYGHLKRTQRIDVLRDLHAKKEHLRFLDNSEENDDNVSQIRLAPQQKLLPQKTLDEVTIMPRKTTVFIEMPEFEYEDHPEYVEVNKNTVETIVIDDDSD